jgi:cell wall-associated NlpC family hydrolase
MTVSQGESARPRRRAFRAAALVLALAAATSGTAGTADGAGAEPAAPPRTSSLPQLEIRVQQLYQRAEAAGGEAVQAGQAVRAQEAEIVRIARRIVAAQNRTAQLKLRIGSFLAAQYRGATALPPALQLLLAKDPQRYLEAAPLAQEAGASAAGLYSALKSAQQQAQSLGQQATDRLQRLQQTQTRAQRAAAQARSELAQAKALLSALKATQLSRLRTIEADDEFTAQVSWLRSLTPAELSRPASRAARIAIGYAQAQIGKPYVWGGTGPNGFDCSGLVMRAWQAAGRSIPRTSEQDWARLPHVPVSRLRPGDLVVYFQDASHVALYVGNGAIIEAPHPGADVKLAGAGSMPVLGVVRPE